MTRQPYVRREQAMVPDDREPKLPVWAQSTLSALRRSVRDAEDKLNAHQATLTQTQVWHGDHQNRIYVPDTARVHFDFSGKGSSLDAVQVGWERDALLVMGGQPIAIFPQAANTFYLRLAR